MNKYLIFVGGLLAHITLCSMNLLTPYDPVIRPFKSESEKMQFFVMIEGGAGSAKGFNAHEQVDTLHMYESTQNALTMLEGFPAQSMQSNLLAQLSGANTIPFCVRGDLKLDAAWAISMRYMLSPEWSINAYLPFHSMRLSHVSWVDQTARVTVEDQLVHQLLTDNFAANIYMLGGGLTIDDWHRVGPGDLTFLLEWCKEFPQAKPVLRNVTLDAWAGISAPTGLRGDTDKIVALPFGFDGAWALPFSFDLEITLGKHVRCGFDVQLTHIFGHTSSGRIPTACNQTTLLYLQKACVFKNFGWNQQFTIYGGVFDLPKGSLLRIGYEFAKQGESTVSLVFNDFSTEIANRSPVLESWTSHQIIVRADYQFKTLLDDDAPVLPTLSLFARIPFNGKRSALFTTIGGSFTLDF